MSLLLEALKKAEKAKEEAQRRARDGSEPELKLEGDAPGSPLPAELVRTRDKLPEIPQPLEILADDLAPPKASSPPRPAPRARPEPLKSEPGSGEAAGRAAAKKVFEAKFKEPNPRLPFYITMGVLGAFALGTVVYLWMQLRPPPPLVNTSPVRPAGEVTVRLAAQPNQAQAAPAAARAATGAIPGLPSSTPIAEPQPPAAAPPPAELRPAPKPRVRQARPAPARAKVAAAPETSAAPQRRRASLTAAAPPAAARAAPSVHPRVDAAYAAYLAGDVALSRTHYEEALRDEPANRDALLGLAALEVKGGRYESAEATYLRLLQADPRDSQAQAALIALRGGRLDPLVAESRVKSLLAADPGAHVLNFTLGNQLAQQGRWGEAQQEYFKAFSAEPDNADFAYNLAVSLDHLRQPRLALQYYRRAIALAEKRGASFELSAARSRAAQLDP